MKKYITILVLLFTLGVQAQDTLQIIQLSDIQIVNGVGEYQVTSLQTITDSTGTYTVPYVKLSEGWNQGLPNINLKGKVSTTVGFETKTIFWHGFHDSLVADPIYQFAYVGGQTYSRLGGVWVLNPPHTQG